MKKFINLYIILGVSFLFLFILLLILLNFDKAVIAESGEEVGLSHINNLVKYEFNDNIDFMTDLLLYVTFIVVAYAGFKGLYQLITKKSLFKVDRSIIIFGVSLIVMVGLWLIFTKVIKVNIRPTNNDRNSFPSIHVMVATFLALSSHAFLCLNDRDKLVKYSSLVLAIVIIAIITVSRVAAGMHYITDVTGGLCIGLFLYFTTFGIIKVFKKNKEKVETEVQE
ncbi:MAG: phosphatase PAP2 family protein [Acholeplasmatales bacterium]|nr:phosphatase PAP2 family protein [Acholeplasmatales bacterium]